MNRNENNPDQIALVPPLETLHVTSGFGPRTHPITGKQRSPHPGVDFRAATGAPVFAVAGGVVVRSYFSRGDKARGIGSYGERIVVAHPGGYESSYAHLSERLAREGEQVVPGQLIGRAGSTGDSTGPHLHFELRFRNVPLDPMPLLIRG